MVTAGVVGGLDIGWEVTGVVDLEVDSGITSGCSVVVIGDGPRGLLPDPDPDSVDSSMAIVVATEVTGSVLSGWV